MKWVPMDVHALLNGEHPLVLGLLRTKVAPQPLSMCLLGVSPCMVLRQWPSDLASACCHSRAHKQLAQLG